MPRYVCKVTGNCNWQLRGAILYYLHRFSDFWSSKAKTGEQLFCEFPMSYVLAQATKRISQTHYPTGPMSCSTLNHFNLPDVLGCIKVPYGWAVFKWRPRTRALIYMPSPILRGGGVIFPQISVQESQRLVCFVCDVAHTIERSI